MIRNQRRRITVALGAAAGGLVAAAVLPIAVAFADQEGYVPDPLSLHPTEITGFPPYSPEVIMGSESWSLADFTTGHVLVADQLSGVDTNTVFGPFTNDVFTNGDFNIDFATFGGGWANEWIYFPDVASPASDLLITPFGDFPLFGTFFP